MEYACQKQLCCRHQNTMFDLAGGGCCAFMATLVVSYRLLDKTSSISRTVCMPCLPSQVRAEVAAGRVVLRHRGGQQQLCGLRDLHVPRFILEHVTQVQLRAVDNVGWMDRNLVSRKRPREMTPPKVVNLCGKASLPDGVSTCVLTEGCARMRLAKGTPQLSEIGTTGKVIISNNSDRQASCIRIVGTDDLYKTLQTLSRLCNVDLRKAPSVHMGIFCATLPHSTSMPAFCVNVECVQRLHPGIFSVEDCEDGKDECMMDIKVEDWTRFMGGFHAVCASDGGRMQALLQALRPCSRQALEHTRGKIKVTHYGNIKIQLTWTEEAGGHLPWTQENVAVVNYMITSVVQFFEMLT